MIRKQSSRRLTDYLADKKKALTILEAGCGNGWLSHRLSAIPGVQVMGLDINSVELQQAKRVFTPRKNLQFVLGDIRDNVITGKKFDIILFAASVQYFPSLPGILNIALQHLNKEGEIHIIDSPWYPEKEVAAAQQRTAAYYHSLGLPGMTGYYFHHHIEELKTFPFKILYNPFSVFNKLRQHRNRFHWIRIQKD